MATSLDRALLTRAFERLGELAQSEGLTIEIAVFGGAYIVLCSDIRISTRDVDAVFRTHDDAAYRLADIVGRELMLPGDWLNQSVKRYVAPAGAPAPDLLPFGEFPRTGAPGLRVLVPRPEYVLAMKLLANRDSVDDIARDAADIAGLMRLCSLQERPALLRLVEMFYPMSAGIRSRIEAKLDDVYARMRRPESGGG